MVEYLEAMRQECWGKRDAWARLVFGVGVGVGQALGAIGLPVGTGSSCFWRLTMDARKQLA